MSEADRIKLKQIMEYIDRALQAVKELSDAARQEFDDVINADCDTILENMESLSHNLYVITKEAADEAN